MFVMTNGIRETLSESKKFAKEICVLLKRYLHQDWGDLTEEDKQINDEAYKNKNDRVLARYETSQGIVYVINESYGNITTILFANEY